MVWKGYRRPLGFDDLWNLNEDDTAEEQVLRFSKFWDAAVQEAKMYEELYFLNPNLFIYYAIIYRKSLKPGKEKLEISIISILFKCFWKTLFVAIFLKIVQDLLPFISPELLK